MFIGYKKPLTCRPWYAAMFMLAASSALAQTPVWNLAQAGSTTQTSSTAQALATAADANGNVLVAGYFTGQLTLGNTTLTSAGDQDLFVAKWVPATSTWAWAQRGGGTGTDQAQGIAVHGSTVYITGYLTNTTANAAGATLGATTINGASATSSPDLLLAKYTDTGNSATLSWAQVAGGTAADRGSAVAVNGTSVYITGAITNNKANSNTVVFGANVTQAGANAATTGNLDMLLAKYTDGGSSATFNWAQVAGGSADDESQGLAVSGTALYVTGYLTNNKRNDNAVVFNTAAGAAVSQIGANPNGTPSPDLVLARYTDGSSGATLGWVHVAGGNDLDKGFGVAVSGANIYVTGVLTNSLSNTTKVVFGTTGTTVGSAPQYGATATNTPDLLVAKYNEASDGASASFNWSEVGGGNANDATQPLSDQGQAIAVSGSDLYVTGALTNSSTNTTNALFGGSGTTQGTATQSGASSTSSKDVLVAKYTDNGTTATLNWTQVGGGTAAEQGQALALVNNDVYVVGSVVPAATFGSLTSSSPAGVSTLLLGRLGTAAPLPVTLTSFTATRTVDQAAVRVAWTTASETNSATFEVERSPDGATFTSIGAVAAAGGSRTLHPYALTDAALPAGTAVLYYRLRQLDLDGSFSYSPVRTVALATKLAVYPNPAGRQATLSGGAPGQTVQVLNALGRVVLAATADASGTAGLALPASLPGGVYMVRVGQQALRLAVE